jgi:hypothetical protein
MSDETGGSPSAENILGMLGAERRGQLPNAPVGPAGTLGLARHLGLKAGHGEKPEPEGTIGPFRLFKEHWLRLKAWGEGGRTWKSDVTGMALTILARLLMQGVETPPEHACSNEEHTKIFMEDLPQDALDAIRLLGRAALLQDLQQLPNHLEPAEGNRPGRPTKRSWTLHRHVHFSDETWHVLERLATRVSTRERRVTPDQVASYLLERVLEDK